jgi:1-acyl-sn-glycerol-3-phosphate acyltransferase
MLSKLRGIFVLIQFSLTVAIIIILMYILPKYAVAIRKFWMKIQIPLLGIKIKTIGEPDPNANLILMNHQALLDIVVMEYLDSRDIAWVAKKEIAKLFFFGHILKAPKMIIVDRQNKAGLIKLLKDVKDRLNHNRPIAMFPEGTRSDGTKLLKFKTGAKLVALKHNLIVQPVLLFHTREVLDSKTLNANPGTVKVIYLNSVDPSKDKDWFEKLEKDMNERFYKELNSEH